MHTKYTNLNARGTIGEIAELPDDVERDESQPCGLSWFNLIGDGLIRRTI